MAKKQIFGMEPLLTNRATDTFTKQLVPRLKAVMKMIPYIGATEVRKNLLEMIPETDQYKAYRNALRVTGISGFGAGQSGTSININPKARRVRKIDSSKTVIYVRPKKPTREKNKITVLEEMGPWTTDTIPFWPKKSEATVIQRQVSKREVEIIAKKQEAAKANVRSALDKVGVRATDKKGNKKVLPSRKNAKAIPDTTYLALSLEFGASGTKPIPAWRKSLRSFRKTGIKKAMRTCKPLKAALMDSRSTMWKRFPKRMKSIKLAEAKKQTGFAKKVGTGKR